MKRYEWEDALIDAQSSGEISNGDLLVALKLAKAINWNPSAGRKPGLYWKNEDALEAVGCSRATFYRNRKSLVETGFLVMYGGNILPAIPQESQDETFQEVSKSQDETAKSQVETRKSQNETQKSQVEHPFTVDILPVDVLSEDSLSEDESVPDSTDILSDDERKSQDETGSADASPTSNSESNLMSKMTPSNDTQDRDSDAMTFANVTEMKMEVWKRARDLKETPADEFWVDVLALACDGAFSNDVSDAVRRVMLAQQEVSAIKFKEEIATERMVAV